jgi:hypothetical protein
MAQLAGGAMGRTPDGRDVFENTVPYDEALMSTHPRTTIIRQGADGFIGRSNIIGSDGAPAVIEVTYARAR